jgi:penicillin-binding protein 2
MQEVVEGGTAWRTRIEGIAVCAKTGTVENPHGEDHSVCIAFAPRDNPQIALSVYVENAGWGARASASIAGLLIEKYLNGVVSRSWLQDYVLKGDFLH